MYIVPEILLKMAFTHTVRRTPRLMGVFDTIWDLGNETDNVSTRSRYVKLHTNRHDFMATTTLLNCNLLDFSLSIDHLYIPDLILRLYIFSCLSHFLNPKWYQIHPLTLVFVLLCVWEPSWSWSCGRWIYNYLCNQCLSLLTFESHSWRGVIETTLYDKVC
jgi:hypothetical protein